MYKCKLYINFSKHIKIKIDYYVKITIIAIFTPWKTLETFLFSLPCLSVCI